MHNKLNMRRIHGDFIFDVSATRAIIITIWNDAGIPKKEKKARLGDDVCNCMKIASKAPVSNRNGIMPKTFPEKMQ